MQRRFILLGASRGLGWSTFQLLQKRADTQAFLLSSRKIQARTFEIEQLLEAYPADEAQSSAQKSKQAIEQTAKQKVKQAAKQEIKLVAQDFSKLPIDGAFLQDLENFQATDLIYFAGGGPFGSFADKKWNDHQWALNTTFLYPAQLMHQILSQKKTKWPDLRNLVVIGSAIAESKPDPKAASYAAAKHALKGLIDTVQFELDLVQGLRVHLFSPGYMQTDLLPAHSEPRQKQLAENPLDVAKKLITVIERNDSIGPS